MTKVMVIGAGGWLGERLTERLVEAGREVICVDVRLGNKFRGHPGVEMIEADIRNMALFTPRFSECKAVFNCCGVQHPRTTKDIYAVNSTAPVAVYRECIAHGVKTFVHISSISAYGANESPTVFIDESSPVLPITHYGTSKAQCDAELRSLVAPDKTRLIILQPGVYYGERPSKNLQEFMDKLQTSSMPLFSARGMLRTYVDIAKVVDAMLLAEHNGQSGSAYLIGDEGPIATLRFYQIVADELGSVPKTIHVPMLAARICEKLAFFAGRFGVHVRLLTIVGEFGRHTYCESTKAKNELGFLPHKSSESGLRSMVQSVKK